MIIKKEYLTKDILLKIKKIDEEFYNDPELNIDWYLKRYNSNNYAFCLIDNEDIVGYINSVPIKKELYDAIVSGVILNDTHINPDMFINESNYNYIISCVIKEDYRHKNYGKLLIETLLNDLNNYSACCLTISKDGYRLAKKYMTEKLKLNEDVSVFEIKR